MSKRHQRRQASKPSVPTVVPYHRGTLAQPATRPSTPSQRSFLAPGLGFGQGMGMGGGHYVPPYEAASMDHSIVRAGNIGPVGIVAFQPLLSSLSRHSYRNDAWYKRIITKQADNVVGVGPQPSSAFDELNDLWSLWFNHVDARGVNCGGDWLREDVFIPSMIDGEVFLRKQIRPMRFDPMGKPIRYGDKLIPLTYTTMLTDFFPVWNTSPTGMANGQVISSIEYDAYDPDQRVAYWGYQCYPGDYPARGAQSLLLNRFPASEILHYYKAAMPGSPRGEVQLACAMIMAQKVSRFQDAEFTRMDVASRFAGYIKETAQNVGESQIAGTRQVADDVIDGLMSMLSMEPGMLYRLPPGFEMQFASPPPTTPGGVEILKFMVSYICAAAGIPTYEVGMDYSDLSDRVMKMATLSYQQVIDRERSKLANQVLNPMWRTFVDMAIVMGLWRPPSEKDMWRAYVPSWRWPLIKQTQMTQEIPAMIAARDAGFISTDTVAQNYFGGRARDVLRQEAEYQGRARAVGFSPDPPPLAAAPPAPEPEPTKDDKAVPKKKPDSSEPAPAPAPAAPTASGKATIPQWNPANSPIAKQILDRMQAEEEAAQAVIASTSEA
jgi:capsid protein